MENREFDPSMLPPEETEKSKEGREHIPSREEITGEFKRLIGEAEYTTSREESDDRGIAIWCVEVKGDKPGEVTEYVYIRKGQHKGGSSIVTSIEITYYDDGMPVGGRSGAYEKDGVWLPAG